jgi:predicted transcriptional regulator
MERLCSLFFELSNETRLSIILKLMDEPMTLTLIARELDLSVQECSRQLARLNEIDLVAKDPDGFFVLQPYGRRARARWGSNLTASGDITTSSFSIHNFILISP